MRPSELPAGTYCLVGRARDGECVWFADGDRLVQLPAEADQELIVDLESSAESAACAIAECTSGRCGGSGDGGADAGPQPDSGVDGGPDAGPIECSGSQLDCDMMAANGCETDTTSDPLNCGDCSTSCGAAMCVSSVCTCEAPLVFDGSRSCIDTMLDPDHCGALMNVCRDDQWCDAGSCECRPGLTDDGAGACVDRQTDPGNCGSIGTDCSTMGSMVTCRGGSCEDACTTGQTNCSNACVDTQTDPLHCGLCDRVCERNRYCLSGSCERYEPGTGCSSCPCSACGGEFERCRTYGTAIICVRGD